VHRANRLESRSGPTYVGPDLDYSLFASSTIPFSKILPKSTSFKVMQTIISWKPFSILVYYGLKIP